MTTIRDPIKDVLQSNPPMEGVVTLVAEWFSHGEMIKLHGVSVFFDLRVRFIPHRQFEHVLDTRPTTNFHTELKRRKN